MIFNPGDRVVCIRDPGKEMEALFTIDGQVYARWRTVDRKGPVPRIRWNTGWFLANVIRRIECKSKETALIRSIGWQSHSSS